MLLGCTFVSAAPPPGKGKGGGGGDGGAGQNGGGVIYFTYEIDVYTMNDDGSGSARVTGLGDGGYGSDPSYRLHAGKRWFIGLNYAPGRLVAHRPPPAVAASRPPLERLLHPAHDCQRIGENQDHRQEHGRRF